MFCDSMFYQILIFFFKYKQRLSTSFDVSTYIADRWMIIKVTQNNLRLLETATVCKETYLKHFLCTLLPCLTIPYICIPMDQDALSQVHTKKFGHFIARVYAMKMVCAFIIHKVFVFIPPEDRLRY